jgi:hypothetical protein
LRRIRLKSAYWLSNLLMPEDMRLPHIHAGQQTIVFREPSFIV